MSKTPNKPAAKGSDEKNGQGAEKRPPADLVNIAVAFLTHPEMQNYSEADKTKFLKSKNLTDAQIKKAMKLAEEKLKAAEEKEKAAEAAKAKAAPSKATNGATTSVVAPEDEPLEDVLEKAQISDILSIKRRSLKEIPQTIFDSNQNLEILIVSFNPIAKIPDSIKSLSRLRRFHAFGCGLTDKSIEPV
eukprot:TRINITY_DN3457_c0_g2_i2.p1 TRINITY_DN3457_c0_g2~~TRINITY_DN3457_c0_g2_i2.p1  ORF type:complete len:189 (+),score=58.82 TRINITY_DN3457_c0_g2_i2:35-601(+)